MEGLKMENQNLDFDPELSEYNPLFTEIETLKNKMQKKTSDGFISSLIEKLTRPIIIQID